MNTVFQPELSLVDEMIQPSVALLANAPAESRGEVYTKQEVVSFILDLIGWKTDTLSKTMRLLEPSAGEGDFLIPAIDRLLATQQELPISEMETHIVAVEINKQSFDVLRNNVETKLRDSGFTHKEVMQLCDAWLLQGDFLSTPFKGCFTHVIGNPPYLRLEALPRALMQYYRQQFSTMYDRSDLYVAFFEKGLSLLAPQGKLGYICSDRWMKNKYGGPLRKWIAEHYHLETYIDFSGCEAFHSDVTAYPAVTIIRNGKTGPTRIVRKNEVTLSNLSGLSEALASEKSDTRVQKLNNIAAGSSPWLLTSGTRLNIVQELEQKFPSLEAAGCKVGIGVATGADKVYIGSDQELDVESERKLPLVTRKDLRNNQIKWTGQFVLNPYEGNGRDLVDLDRYPRFKRYIMMHQAQIQRRHVAKKNPAAWFKTIDRISPPLMAQAKLLIPDIQGNPQVVYDSGEFYPHHNLYYITSESWNLQALQAVLRSPLAKAFIATYSLRMRGDYLRFQAQYHRRIRLPLWLSVPESLRKQLTDLSHSGTDTDLNTCVRKLYGISQKNWDELVKEKNL
jgi:hypothetical protein